MKRKQFLASLGIIVGGGMVISEFKSQKLTLTVKNSNADMNFGVNGVERMRIHANGTHSFIP